MTGNSQLANVSVIVPAWRSERTIERTLSSIARQTIRPREVIVVDDGSDDGTFDAAERMRGRLQPIALKVVRQDNRGPGSARNRAISESSAPVLAFLDADDEWLPEKLARSLEVLGEPSITLVAHNILVDDGRSELELDCARHLPGGEDPFVALFKRGFVATTSVVCRRDAIEAVGGFDESLLSGQDYELWLAIARTNRNRLVVLPEVLARYHLMSGSVSSNVELRRRCAIRIARRHMVALRGRARFPLSVLVFRLSVIMAEATTAQARRRAWIGAVMPIMDWPLCVVSSAVRMMLRAAPPDPAIRTHDMVIK